MLRLVKQNGTCRFNLGSDTALNGLLSPVITRRSRLVDSVITRATGSSETTGPLCELVGEFL